MTPDFRTLAAIRDSAAHYAYPVRWIVRAYANEKLFCREVEADRKRIMRNRQIAEVCL